MLIYRTPWASPLVSLCTTNSRCYSSRYGPAAVTDTRSSTMTLTDSNLRFDRHARNVAKACVPHSRPAPRAQSTDRRRRPDSRVQHRRVEARLLQRSVMWCTGGDIRQASACPEQPGQSRLPEPGSHRRQAAAPVTSLASSETAGVTYKVAQLTHKVRATATPAYLSDLIQTHVPIRTLRSSEAPLLAVPRARTELARRAFSVAAPSVWNYLPADIRLYESVPSFKRHLKTHLFRLT